MCYLCTCMYNLQAFVVSFFKQNLTYNDDLHTACTAYWSRSHAHACTQHMHACSISNACHSFSRGDTRLQRIYMLSLLYIATIRHPFD